MAQEDDYPVVLSGANLDDLGDFRPGLRAAQEHGVRHPLVEAAMTKADVREAARALGIPTWDKPASACLSSRIKFGVTITVEELSKVGRAERVLKDLGFRQCRVRVHDAELVARGGGGGRGRATRASRGPRAGRGGPHRAGVALRDPRPGGVPFRLA